MPPATPLESHSGMPGGPHKILHACAPCLFQLLSSHGTWILSLLPSSPVTPRLVRPGEADTNDQSSEGSPEPTYARCQHKLIPLAQMVQNLPAMQETQFQSLGQEDPLEKGMTTHSNILAWRIPWTEDPTVHWGHKELDRIERPLLERPPRKFSPRPEPIPGSSVHHGGILKLISFPGSYEKKRGGLPLLLYPQTFLFFIILHLDSAWRSKE